MGNIFIQQGFGTVVSSFIAPTYHQFVGGPDLSNYFRGFGHHRHNNYFENPDVGCRNTWGTPPTSVQAGPWGNDNINVNPDQYNHYVNANGRNGNDNITVNRSNGSGKTINVDGGRGFDRVKLQGEGLRLNNIGMSWDKKTGQHVKTYQFADPRGNVYNIRNAEQLLLDRNGDGHGTNLNLGAMESQFYAARARGEGGISMDHFEAQQTGDFGS